MANERTGENPVQKSADKAAAPRSRHRSGHSGRQSQNPADRKFPQPQSNPADRKAVRSWTWRDFALQFSVVVAGIVVTFVGSGLISRWAQAREVKSVMQLVVSELEANRAQMHRAAQRLIKERHGMLMFMSYGFDVDKIPEDSLRFYNEPHPIGSSVGLTLRNDALEVLKTSGAISSVGDKELLLEVLGCYNRLQTFNGTLDDYNNQKLKGLDHLFASMTTRDMEQFSIGSRQMHDSWRVMLDDPMCRSFMGFSAYFFGDDSQLNQRVSDIDRSIELIRKKYNFE